MTKYVCCEQCFKELYKEDPWAGSFWMELVRQHIDQRYLYYVLREESIVTLEKMGFVVSYETRDLILFYLKGKQEDFFCVQPQIHNQSTCQ